MAPSIPDRYLWLGLAATSFLAYYTLQHAVTDLVTCTAPHATATEQSKSAEKQAEHSISLAALKTLALSPTPSIASAARSLLLSRATTDHHALAALRRDAASADPALRRRAELALHFLAAQSGDAEQACPAHGLLVADDVVHGVETVHRFARDLPVRDAGEAQRRWQRREAVVVHDGDGMVGEEDIIRPR